MDSQLMQQNLSITEQVWQGPGFATVLAQMLTSTGGRSMPVTIANGRTVANCRKMRIIGPLGCDQQVTTVTLRQLIPIDRLCIEFLAGKQLTLLQRRLALFAMQGVIGQKQSQSSTQAMSPSRSMLLRSSPNSD